MVFLFTVMLLLSGGREALVDIAGVGGLDWKVLLFTGVFG
jgi:hypothetical protein